MSLGKKMAKSKKKISANAYAKHRGVSGEAVKKAIQQGRINAKPNAKGQYEIDPVKADKEWERNTLPTYSKKKNTKKEIPPTIGVPIVKDDEEENNEEEVDDIDQVEPNDYDPESDYDEKSVKLSYNQAKTLKENYNAQLAKLKFEEASGLLISAEKVKEDSYKMARAVRNQLLALPDRIAGEIASMKDAHKINLKLIEEITQCLESLVTDEV